MKKSPQFGDNQAAIQGQPRLTSEQAWAQVESHLGVSLPKRRLPRLGNNAVVYRQQTWMSAEELAAQFKRHRTAESEGNKCGPDEE
jgi:hypothetical protein